MVVFDRIPFESPDSVKAEASREHLLNMKQFPYGISVVTNRMLSKRKTKVNLTIRELHKPIVTNAEQTFFCCWSICLIIQVQEIFNSTNRKQIV